MDDKKDATFDEPVEDSSTEPAETLPEQAEELVEHVESVDGDAEPVVVDEPAATDEAVENDAVVAEEADDEAAAAKEDLAEKEPGVNLEKAAEPEASVAAPVAPEASAAPAAPEKRKSSSSGLKDLIIVSIFSLILGGLLVLPGALGLTSGGEKSETASGSVAATVNGTTISEDEITKYVTDFRTSQGLEKNDDWARWMVAYGYTAKDLRSDTIEYFVNRELLKQAVAEQGVQVDDAKIDEYIAAITEQVGGEDAFNAALEQEGLDLNTYRDEVRFSLEQQALAEKVVSADTKVDDAQVLEVVKMYFPDAVDENAKNLDGVDKETVDQVRSMLESSAVQEAFSKWMDDYRSKAKVVIVDMPASLPYDIDLTPYQEAAKQAEQNESSANGEEVDEIEVVDGDGEEVEIVEASEGSSEAASSSASASAQSK